MGFSDELKASHSNISDRIKGHHFVTRIGDGSLPIDRFRYYMVQDYFYLECFCRAISIAAAKAEKLEDMAWFAQLLYDTLNTEIVRHISLCSDLGITESDLKSAKPSQSTVAYTQHLMRTANRGGTGEIASAILPCFWGYYEIGQMLAGKCIPSEQPIYARWIETYSSDKFGKLVEWLRSFIDRTASGLCQTELDKMASAFLASTRYEYMFWDAAYRMKD